MFRTALVLLGCAACGGSPLELMIDERPIATGAVTTGLLSACAERDEHDARICRMQAFVTSSSVVSNDPAAFEVTLVRGSAFNARALAPGRGRLTIDAMVAPGGAMRTAADYRIVDAAGATPVCRRNGSTGLATPWRCDGTELPMLAGQEVTVGWSDLVDASGAPLGGAIELTTEGAVQGADFNLKGVSTARGRVTVRPSSPQLAALLGTHTADFVAAEDATGLAFAPAEWDRRGAPALVSELSLTAAQEAAGGAPVELLPLMQTATGWALPPYLGVKLMGEGVVTADCWGTCGLKVLHPGTATFRMTVGERTFEASLIVRAAP